MRSAARRRWPRAEHRAARPGGGRRGLRQGRRDRRRSPAHVEPAHLRRRRRLLAVQVHARRRCDGAHRDSERAVLRAGARERAGDPLVHLHRPRGRARRAGMRTRRGGRGTASKRHRSARTKSTGRSWTRSATDSSVFTTSAAGCSGCTVVSSRAGEMIGMATHALTRGASLNDFGATILPVPDADQRVPRRRRRVSPHAPDAARARGAAAVFPAVLTDTECDRRPLVVAGLQPC